MWTKNIFSLHLINPKSLKLHKHVGDSFLLLLLGKWKQALHLVFRMNSKQQPVTGAWCLSECVASHRKSEHPSSTVCLACAWACKNQHLPLPRAATSPRRTNKPETQGMSTESPQPFQSQEFVVNYPTNLRIPLRNNNGFFLVLSTPSDVWTKTDTKHHKTH